MFKYEVIFGPYFPVLGLNTEIYGVEKHGQEITPYFDTFHAVPGTESNTKGQYQQLYHTFLGSYIDQKEIALQNFKYQLPHYIFFESSAI